MKKTREYSISKRTRKAFLLAAVILIPITFIMVLLGMRLTQNRENAHIEMKMNALAKLVANENEMLDASEERFERNLSAYLNMVTTSLRALVTEDGYTGPRVFSDGFVAELRGDSVILPEGMPAGRAELSRSLIEESIESGEMLTGVFDSDEKIAPKHLSLPDDVAEKREESDATSISGTYLLSFGRINDDLVYVDMTSEAELDEEINAYVVKNYTALENENGGFGGITLVVNETDDGVELLRSYGDSNRFGSLSDLGITPEQIRQRTPILAVNGVTYSCIYSTLQGEWDGWENPIMIQMLPIATVGMRSIIQSMIICYGMALILINMIVYVMSVQRYVRDNVVTQEQAARYNPRKLRIRMINAGAVGVLAILVMSLIVQGVGQLYIELSYARETLRVFAKQLE